MSSGSPSTLTGSASPSKHQLLSECGRLLSLAIPVSVSFAAAVLIGVVDTLMIAPLGTPHLAAASIVSAVMILFYSAVYGVISVIGVRIAEAFGEGGPGRLNTTVGSGLLVSLGIGTLACIVMAAVRPLMRWVGQPDDVLSILGPYWTSMSLTLIPYALFYTLKSLYDSIDRPWLGVFFAFVAVAVNVPANYVFIYGLGEWDGLGLLGSGIASLLSQSISFVLAWAFWRGAPSMKNWRRPFDAAWSECRTQLIHGLPVAFGYVGEGGAYAFVGLMLGWFGAVALAANQIVSSIGSVLYMLPLGMAIATSVRVGQAVGASEQHRVRLIGLTALAIVTVWMSIIAGTLVVGAPSIASALSVDAEVIALAASMFVVVAAMQIFEGVQSTALGALRGMTDNRIPVIITLFTYWMVGLPLGYLLGFGFNLGPNGVWAGYGFALMAASLALTWRLLSVTRGARLRRTGTAAR